MNPLEFRIFLKMEEMKKSTKSVKSDDNLPTIFHEPNSWEKYEIIKKMIDEAYQKWVRSTA